MQQLSDEGLDSAKIMRVVNHPVRMRIIQLLAVRPMSWKELSTELGVKTGALYHHLDTLEKIVTRDPERRYTLTKLGQEVYQELNVAKTPAQSMQAIERAMKRRTFAGSLREVFVPRALVVSLTSTKPRAAATLAVVSALVVGLLLFSGDELILFSFSPSSDVLVSVGTYVGSLVVVSAAAYVALAVAFKERGEALTLLASTSLAFVPLCVFGGLLHATYAGTPPGSGGFPLSVLSDTAAVTVIFAFFQAWGAGVIGAGMSAATGLRVEKTLVVSLVVLYASMLVVLVQGGRLA